MIFINDDGVKKVGVCRPLSLIHRWPHKRLRAYNACVGRILEFNKAIVTRDMLSMCDFMMNMQV